MRDETISECIYFHLNVNKHFKHIKPKSYCNAYYSDRVTNFFMMHTFRNHHYAFNVPQ